MRWLGERGGEGAGGVGGGVQMTSGSKDYFTYQWTPVGVEITYPECRDKLSQRHDQEVQVEKQSELIKQDLKGQE